MAKISCEAEKLLDIEFWEFEVGAVGLFAPEDVYHALLERCPDPSSDAASRVRRFLQERQDLVRHFALS